MRYNSFRIILVLGCEYWVLRLKNHNQEQQTEIIIRGLQ